ncbi:hypothetical protein JQ617_09580 [Bradyrhizobium sp. KB893862 SZCCT0404]|uniref:hypothetical protein n=1 Tax=Bradyrhizobium sp. KB893862 SZCCT0404 TaxID=2807672 RepID=UPI001BAD1BE3|nr:hypothetical protein [Bradyrhizobium sp. KB893862 SZCCT0404]MBR1174204.1 hypothetical protein [Bradyrhizobium sp. KB893862 SZCCT0404]
MKNGFASVLLTRRLFETPVSKLGADELPGAPTSSPIYFAAIFGWTMSAVSAVICAVVRMPLGSPHWFAFIKAFLLAAAIISCATVLTVRCVEQRRSGYAPVLLSMLAVMFLPCFAWLIGAAATDIVAYPLLFGLIAIGVRQVVAARDMPGSRFMLALTCGCAAGVGYFFVVNSKGYATVLTPEQAVVGTQHLDTLFHAAIANMLLKYGALSFGLDGLTPIKYHVLSHIWLGCLGIWLRVPTLDAYYIGAQIVAIPMLFFSLASSVHLLRPLKAGSGDDAVVTLFPLLLLFVADLWGYTSYLVSESYILSIILLLLALPLLAEIAADEFRLRPSLQIAALVITGILIQLSKVSVGVIFWGAAGFLLWRQQGLTLPNLIKLALPILLFVAPLAAIFSPDAGSYSRGLSPFRFVVDYPRAAWPNIAAHLVLLCAAAKVWLSGSARDRKVAETFVIIVAGCLLPALLLDIYDTAYYFMNVGTWGCIVFISAYGLAVLGEGGLRWLTPGVVILAIALVALATDEKRSSLKKVALQFDDLQTRVRTLNQEGVVRDTRTSQRLLELLAPGNAVRAALADDVKRTSGAEAKQTLLSLGLAQDRHSAVFVPPDNSVFWSTYEDCRGDPFFVSAIIGVPLLKGLTPSALKCGLYSPPVYAPDASSAPTTDIQLCLRAARSSLTTVFVLETPTIVRKIDCPLK